MLNQPLHYKMQYFEPNLKSRKVVTIPGYLGSRRRKKLGSLKVNWIQLY